MKILKSSWRDNSQIGLLEANCNKLINTDILNEVQNVLFVIGSHLATEAGSNLKLPELKEESIVSLENEIDKMEGELSPLKTFILPGGSMNISLAHICRTVCRRAERRCVSLSYEEDLNTVVIPYLNRLSDFMFVLSRYIAHKEGLEEKPWIPNNWFLILLNLLLQIALISE